MNINSKLKNNFLIFLIGLIMGSVAIFFYFNNYSNYKNTIALRLGQQGFVNPLVVCDSSDVPTSTHLLRLKNLLAEDVNSIKRKNLITRASIYFRDLNLGEWTGVNEDDLYDPASLKKVPLMIAYFKNAEFDPAILDKYLLLDKQQKDENKEQFFKPPTSLTPGNYYKIGDLIYRMIVYSGNNSYGLLFNNINKFLLAKVYTDLDILPTDNVAKLFVSPKAYSTMWRALFNASYLGQEMSNRSLDLLSKSEFKYGLSAVTPLNIPIAHKFGERTDLDHDGSVILRQLHDCGIVYYPEHPYLLCIMTEGKDFNQLETVIQNISKTTYKYIDSKYKK